jgi:hypothetical protein
MHEAAEDIDPLDQTRQVNVRRAGNRRLELNAAVWPASVVMIDIGGQDPFEVTAVPDQDPI